MKKITVYESDLLQLFGKYGLTLIDEDEDLGLRANEIVEDIRIIEKRAAILELNERSNVELVYLRH